jgi:protein O-mannosyl-transferase
MLKKATFLLPFFAVLFFLPALTGPLLLDDSIHLDPILNWLNSRADTFDLIFGNKSGPFGRPVSILSFVLNVLTTGTRVWPMKATNLLLHLVTGLCLSKLSYRLFKRDANLLEQAKVFGITAASLWLILPQHISTVFYVIQRMTILAALFSVLACWLYVLARERIETDQKHGLFFLFSVLVVSLLSVLCKETGLFIPLYCLLIELTYFQPCIGKPRPKLITWCFRLGVIYPCVLVAAYLALNPSFVLAPYTDRPFSMPERAMTQISVLADYFASTFIPMVRSAGVFNDDFPIAHTMAAKEYLLLLTGIGLIFAAIRLRKSMPSFSFGIGIFFIGHLLESSIFSLEIYFSHRNYLPSIGLVIAAFGLIAGLLKHYPENTAPIKRIIPVAYIGLFLAYALVNYDHATLWSNNNSLMTHAQIHHPASSRMRSEILLGALYSKRLDVALQQADIAIQTAPINEKRTIQLWRILAYCYAQSPQPSAELEALFNMPGDRITLATSTALEYVSAAAEVNACPSLDRKKLGALSGQWAINTVQYPGSPLVWKTHHAAARLLASGGDLKAGLKQAQWAFVDSGYNFDSGLLAYQLANSLEDGKRAKEIMLFLLTNQNNYNDLQRKQLHELQLYQ